MILEQLDEYQREIVDWAVTRLGSAIFAEQGTGKTWITGGIIERIAGMAYRDGETFDALLVVPLANIQTTWIRLLETIPQLIVCRSWDEYKKFRKGCPPNSNRAAVLILHYEALRGKSLVKRVVQRHWSLIVYDESQRLKARGSQASRVAARFRDADYRVILSGTPIEQSPEDLWAQFRFALPDVFGTRFEDFKNRWLYETGYMGYELKFRQDLVPQFLKLIHPHIRRVLKSDVLDLPPLTYKRATVEMLGEQARVYRDVKRHMMTTVGGDEVTCDMAITQLIALQQITSGFVRVDPTVEEMQRALDEQTSTGRKTLRLKRRAVHLGSAKLRRLKRILRRVELPVVVFCKYKEELASIARACAHLRVGIISGKTRKTRVETIDAFQRGELDVLICQIRAGGVGLDLFRACNGVFFSCTFSSIDFEQAVARLHRRGQTRPVKFWLIQAANTVDKDIWTALLLKKSVTQLILDRRKR